MVLVCHVISEDHVTKGSSNSIVGRGVQPNPFIFDPLF